MRNQKAFKIPAVGTGLTAIMLAALINKYIKNAHKARSAQLDDIDIDAAMHTTGGNDRALAPSSSQINADAQRIIIDNLATVDVLENDTTYPITGSLTIGRYEFNDIAFIKDNSVSRIHCRIFMDKGRYYLVDCNAKYPATINGKMITPLGELRPTQIYTAELHDGDEIGVCDHRLVFHTPDGCDDDIYDDLSTLSSSATI